MPFSSNYPPLNYPKTNILSYLFGHALVSNKAPLGRQQPA